MHAAVAAELEELRDDEDALDGLIELDEVLEGIDDLDVITDELDGLIIDELELALELTQ